MNKIVTILILLLNVVNYPANEGTIILACNNSILVTETAGIESDGQSPLACSMMNIVEAPAVPPAQVNNIGQWQFQQSSNRIQRLQKLLANCADIQIHSQKRKIQHGASFFCQQINYHIYRLRRLLI